MSKSKVIIVDDENDIREGLEDWLSSDYLTQTYDSAESFLTAFNNFEFEDGISTCILLDFQLPGMTGVELHSNLKLMNIEFPIIFMSGNALQADVIDAWRGGAIDYILKPFTANEISEALTKAFASSKKLNAISKSKPSNQKILDIPISKREAQVLLLLGKGLQQTDVAKSLGISLRTVKMYRTFLKNKLGLNTLMELGRYCDEYGDAIKKIAEIK
jgi:FixJ family two-component response regulator